MHRYIVYYLDIRQRCVHQEVLYAHDRGTAESAAWDTLPAEAVSLYAELDRVEVT